MKDAYYIGFRVSYTGFCILPFDSTKAEIVYQQFGLCAFKFRFLSLTKNFLMGNLLCKVLRCLADVVDGTHWFEGRLYERGTELRRKGVSIRGVLSAADVVRTSARELLEIGSVQGKCQVIFDAAKFEFLQARFPSVTRFRCTRERLLGRDVTVLGPDMLTLLQQFQSQLWGPQTGVLPSYMGVPDFVVFEEQAARAVTKAIYDRVSANRTSLGAQCEAILVNDAFCTLLEPIVVSLTATAHSLECTINDELMPKLRERVLRSWTGFPYKQAFSRDAAAAAATDTPPDRFRVHAPIKFQQFHTQAPTRVRVTFSYVLQRGVSRGGGAWEYLDIVHPAELDAWRTQHAAHLAAQASLLAEGSAGAEAVDDGMDE
eukprot:TRINITY_DN7303_c0_g1_i1.p1 TRINITY_DN7303_c0_g1~~TRINITY_DN7303_c0_g1_i1.p1  ORF type:complete len:373 (+),score=27.37 TRINITY_DN7303_c0_g1_i1:1473-2591(+)